MTPIRPNPPPPHALKRAALWTAFGWLILPWLQWAPVDFERGALLVAFAPALLFGSDVAGREWARWWGDRRLRVPGLAGLLALGLSCAGAAQPAPALVQSAEILLLAWLGLLVSGLCRENKAAARWLLTGLIGGALSGVAVLLAAWSLHEAPHFTHPEWLLGFYPHPRHIGLHLLPAAVIVPVLAAGGTSPRARLGLLAIAGVLMAALIWAGGRMPLLAVAVAAGLVFCLSPDKPRRRRIVWAYALSVGAGFVLSTFFWTDSGSFGWWRAAGTTLHADNLNELTSRRVDVWRACMGFIRTHPWFGYGPDGYRFLLPKMDGQQPHNFLIQIILSAGIFGFLWCASAIAMSVRCVQKRASALNKTRMAALAALGAILVGGLFDGTLYHVLSTSALPLCAGLVLAGTATETSTAQRAPDRHLARALACCVLGIFSLHFFVFYRLSPVGTPPEPDSLSARVVRAFPSTTIGLDQWLNTWERTRPDTALKWAKWAQTHSAYAWNYHAWAARYLSERGRFAEARAEAQQFLDTRPQAFRQRLTEQSPRQTAPHPPETHASPSPNPASP